MAYLDLTAGAPVGMFRSAAEAPRRLGPQERLVVLLSRRDPLWSLRPRTTGSRLLKALFGMEAPHRLADPRLEALRRYAVTYRLDCSELAEVERTAAGHGFVEVELAQVRRMIDAPAASSRRGGLATALTRIIYLLGAALLFASLVSALMPAFDSMSIAFVVVAIAGLTLAPFAGARATR
jgi:hypothetical protein